MTYIIDSDEDDFGDKTQMKLFLKECLDFLEGRE